MAILRKWWWLGLALLAVAFGIGYALFADPPAPEPVDDKHALVEFKGADVRHEENGHLVWKLTAEKIMMSPVTKVLYLENAEALFSDGDNQIHVKAERGEVNHSQQTIDLVGSIEIRSNDNIHVKAANLHYDGKTGLLTAKDGIRLQRGDMVLTGDTLTADRTLKTARVKGNAKLVKGDQV